MVKKYPIALLGCLFAFSPIMNSHQAMGSKAVEEKTNLDFVYRADFKAGNIEKGFMFGTNDNKWKVLSSFKDDKITLKNKDEVVLTSSYNFTIGQTYKLSLVVNEGLVRMYVGEDRYSAITYKTESIGGGTYSLVGSATNESYFDTNMYEGAFNIGDLQFEKIVNATDNSYKLTSKDFTNLSGKISLKDEYLKKLKTDTDYEFRVYTKLTEFAYTVHTSFDSVKATIEGSKLYRGNDLQVTLDSSPTISKVEVDGTSVEYTFINKVVTVKFDELKDMFNGTHSIVIYTDNGRPTIKFELEDFVNLDDTEKSSHLFFIIDMVIFGSLILGYVGMQSYQKYKNKGGK